MFSTHFLPLQSTFTYIQSHTTPARLGVQRKPASPQPIKALDAAQNVRNGRLVETGGNRPERTCGYAEMRIGWHLAGKLL